MLLGRGSMTEQIEIISEITPRGSIYRKVLRNRSLMLIWTGGTISTIGDCFFGLAIMWMVYSLSHSLLQTSLIQVVWQLDRILFGTIAGVYADRWNRKRIMVIVNVMSAIVVAILAAITKMWGHILPLEAFITIFVLNTLNTFFQPASSSIMPEVVGRDALVTAQGLFSTVQTGANLIGSALAGVVVSVFGTFWTLTTDAISFLFPAICIGMANLPQRQVSSRSSGDRRNFIKDLREAWAVITSHPILKVMMWINILINVTSFTGPLTPGLVKMQLHSGPIALGMIDAAGVIGAAIGGIFAGAIEQKFGAGRVLVLGWVLCGIALVGIGISTWLPLTLALTTILVFNIVVAGTSMGAAEQLLVPEDYRGRVWGIVGSLSVIAIPVSSLLGGWLADIFGPGTLFVAGGVWTVGVASIAWFNRHVRTARVS